MTVSDLAAAAGLGLSLGVVTGMPLGVVNVAIVDAATHGRTRFAIGIGIGGALADTVHSAIAFASVGHVLTRYPDATRALSIVAAIVVGTYAAIAWRMRSRPAPTVPRRYGIVTGLLLTLPNPAPLAAWIAVAGAVWPTIPRAAAFVVAAGVGIGSALWFTALARFIARLPREHRVTRVLTNVALVLLAALAVVGLVRALV
ncbi:MAG: LysE family transporter [Kofleriaceae bacterium]|nr:LysE family transporter [Kofleriaceae bacterium]